MSNNILYSLIGALAVATAALGYRFYQEHRQTTGIEITVGNGGIAIDTK